MFSNLVAFLCQWIYSAPLLEISNIIMFSFQTCLVDYTIFYFGLYPFAVWAWFKMLERSVSNIILIRPAIETRITDLIKKNDRIALKATVGIHHLKIYHVTCHDHRACTYHWFCHETLRLITNTICEIRGKFLRNQVLRENNSHILMQKFVETGSL